MKIGSFQDNVQIWISLGKPVGYVSLGSGRLKIQAMLCTVCVEEMETYH